MPSNNPNHNKQPRVAGQFSKNPDKPGKSPLSLKVDKAVLEEYKARHGKGFSGKLSQLVEDYMRNDNENSIPNVE